MKIKTGHVLIMLIVVVTAVYAERTRQPVIIIEEADAAAPLAPYVGQQAGDDLASEPLGFSLFD